MSLLNKDFVNIRAAKKDDSRPFRGVMMDTLVVIGTIMATLLFWAITDRVVTYFLGTPFPFE